MRSRSTAGKVAEVTLAFWMAKVVATTLGETLGDFFAQTLGFGYVAGLAVTAVLLLAVVAVQVASASYRSPLFWAAIVATTTAGTEVSDMMDRTLGLGYVAGSAILLAGLASTLLVWWVRKGSLGVEPIVDRETEVLFWIAVIFSNSLGTAFGDALVDAAGLSYAQGALICSSVIAVLILLHHRTSIDAALLFWGAFVFTRPFGATFGDFLTKARETGGLGLGTLSTSLVALAVLVLVVVASDRSDRAGEAEPGRS